MIISCVEIQLLQWEIYRINQGRKKEDKHEKVIEKRFDKLRGYRNESSKAGIEIVVAELEQLLESAFRTLTRGLTHKKYCLGTG